MIKRVLIPIILAVPFIFSLLQSPVSALDQEELKSIYNDTVWYNPSSNSDCVLLEGGPLSGVHFPNVPSAEAFAAAIKDYIKKGWPTSPLIDYSDDFVRLGQQYDVNPAISVVIAQVEYQFGTLSQVQPGAPGQYNFWAVTHNSHDNVRFGAYDSIAEAMEDHFRLLAGKKDPTFTYIGPPQNFTTVSQIMNQYAPSFENKTDLYIQTILDGMKKLLTNAGAGDASYSGSFADSNGCSTAAEGGDTNSVDSAGYAFPIAAKKKSDYSTFGALSQVPCNNDTGCHHPFTPRGSYAFDLGVKGFGSDGAENAPVYAISDGKLVSVKYSRNGNQCNQLEFKSDKDGYVYWYGHLKYDTTVKVGKKYRAGQQVGQVGPSVCADNTTPHLHIDRGYPKGTFGGSECCRDEGIISLINKLYSELPD